MKAALALGGALALLIAEAASAQEAAIVVNECAVGPRGWIELFNRSAETRELAQDPRNCWLVDDADGGGTPKRITDADVDHPTESTTCRTAGRGSHCGLIAPGEHVWVNYAYLNGKTPDRCRFLSAPRSGTRCATATSELSVGGATAGSGTGLCYGRTPDAGAWAPGTLTCTQGNANTGDSLEPSIVKQGTDGLLLVGTIMTPSGAIEGEVLVAGDRIACVGASCRADPLAQQATIVQTNGVVYPGLIDTHNHIQFDVFDESDWSPEPSDHFTNHDQWPNRARYKALVDAKQYLNGESGSKVKIGCELLKYGELKALVAGTTSVVGAPIPSNQACFGSLVRSIDQLSNGLDSDKVQTATPFPSRESADAVCKNFTNGKTDAYLIHIAEGVDETAHKEFKKLTEITTTPGCLLNPKTTIIHGTALDELDFATMAQHGMGLVWSPRSNIFLYGHATDLSQTADIPAALERGIRVALAPDWSIGGSQNMLDELKFADMVDNTQWGDAISPQQFAAMVTATPARLLGLGNVLGSIAVGYKADLMVLNADRSAPYDALLRATPKSVQLVVVGGRALYGERALLPAAAQANECESLELCGTAKFLCASAPGATPANKLGQSYAEIRQIIQTELAQYDAKDITAWDFAPLADLYRCPPDAQRSSEPVATSTPR